MIRKSLLKVSARQWLLFVFLVLATGAIAATNNDVPCEKYGYKITRSNPASLYKVDPDTGEVTRVQNFSANILTTTLGYSSTYKRFYAVNLNDYELYEIDATGQTVHVSTEDLPDGVRLAKVAMDIDPSNDHIFVRAGGSEIQGRWYLLELSLTNETDSNNNNYRVAHYLKTIHLAQDAHELTAGDKDPGADLAINPIDGNIYMLNDLGKGIFVYSSEDGSLLAHYALRGLTFSNNDQSIQAGSQWFDGYGRLYMWLNDSLSSDGEIHVLRVSMWSPLDGIEGTAIVEDVATPDVNGTGDGASCQIYTDPNANVSPPYFPDSDSDGIPNVMDQDDDNDGVLDTDEITCDHFEKADFSAFDDESPSTVINGRVGIGNARFYVTNIAYGNARISVDEISDDHYAGEIGIRIGHHSDTAGTKDDRIETILDFSDAIRNLKFRINDIDYGDHVQVEVYDDRGELIPIDSSRYSLYSPTIVQVETVNENGVQKTIFYAADDDGSDSGSRKGTVDFDFSGFSVSKVVFKYWDPEAAGTVTYTEFYGTVCDFDGDGVPNYLDLDSDNDGITDLIESGLGNPDELDQDHDGVLDSTTDADQDGVMAPVDPDEGGTTIDPVDTDRDTHVDFLDIDSDNDGIVDNNEAQSTNGYRSPSGSDSDGDGLDDAYDPDHSSDNSIVPVDTDGDGVPDYLDTNSDNDRDGDALEAWDTDNDGVANTTPSGSDQDNDGLDDAYDSDDSRVNPTNGKTPSDYPDLDTPGGEPDWRESYSVISGHVFEDITGDALQDGDTTVDDTEGDQRRLANVRVLLYQDNGDGQPGSGDKLVTETRTDDDHGYYFFYVLPQHTYWVVVDSQSIQAPNNGLNSGADANAIWAEQTYGPKGALCADPEDYFGVTTDANVEYDDPYLRSQPGPCYGGVSGSASDDVTSLATAEHVAKVAPTSPDPSADIKDVDFGFSFNVVTNVEDDDITDGDARTCQGCLRQFIQNANAIQGENAMRFVPAVAPNIQGNWWQVALSFSTDYGAGLSLPAISDNAGTVIDGTTHSYVDGTTVRNLNQVTKSAPGPVGVSGTVLADFLAPELEIDVNDKGHGFVIEANNTTIQHVALYNAEHLVTDQNNNVIDEGSLIYVRSSASSGNVVRESFIGARADGSDPEGDQRARAGVTVEVDDVDHYGQLNVVHNYIAHLYNAGVELSGHGRVSRNLIEHIGMDSNCGDGISFEGSERWSRSDAAVAEFNYIRDVAAYGVESYLAPGPYQVLENTITDTGKGDANGEYCGTSDDPNQQERGGIRVFGSDNLIKGNKVFGVSTHAVVVAKGANPSVSNAITQNSFYDNGGLSIDLDQQNDPYSSEGPNPNGDGVTPNDGRVSDDEQNRGLDYPIFTRAELIGNHLYLQGYIGKHNAKLSGTYDVEVYLADPEPPNQGGKIEDTDSDDVHVQHGEGARYLGTCKDVSGSGFTCVIDGVSGVLDADSSVTGITLAKDSDGRYTDTSEFGANVSVEDKAFQCSPGFYQVINKDFKKLDPITKKYDFIGRSRDEYNAIGWDPRTNIIYGIGWKGSTIWNGHLVAVLNDGVARDLGEIVNKNDPSQKLSDLGQYFIAGDMDRDGHLYAGIGLHWEDVVKIDVDHLTFEILDFAVDTANSNCTDDQVGDVVYIPPPDGLGDGKLVGVSKTCLNRWDLATRKVVRRRVTGLPDDGDGLYGAAYTDLTNNLYVSNNDGGVYRIDGYLGDNPVAKWLVNSEEANHNDGASCPLTVAPGFGIPVSGQLFHDLEPNAIRDPDDPAINPEEIDANLQLYVKLFEDSDQDCTNGFTASDAKSVARVEETQTDDGALLKGYYSFPAVSDGYYCLVLDDNSDTSDKTPYNVNQKGWLYTNTLSYPGAAFEGGVLPLEITESQRQGGQASEHNDFGVFHGGRVRGVVFDDTGFGQDGTANDAIQNGNEPGIPSVDVTAKDGQGHTRVTQTDAVGHYTIYVPYDWGTVTLSHDLRPASGYNYSTYSGSGTEKAAEFEQASASNSPVANVSLGSASSLAGKTSVYNFGVVHASEFRPDQTGSTTTPGAVVYSHTYKPGTQGNVILSRTGGDYIYQIRVDANCDGKFDPSVYDPNDPNAQVESWRVVPDDQPITFNVSDAWPRDPNGRFRACNVELRVLVPDGEPDGTVDIAEVEATLGWENNARVLDVVQVVDTTTVRTLGNLQLEKLGCNVTDTQATPDAEDDCDPARFPETYGENVAGRPNDVLEYCIRYSNVGSDPVREVKISDPIPFFADLVWNAYSGDKEIYWKPADSSAGVQYLTAEADQDRGVVDSGVVYVTAEPELLPGQHGLVCYRVRIR